VTTRIVDVDLLARLPDLDPPGPGERMLVIARAGPVPVGRMWVSPDRAAGAARDLARLLPAAVSVARFEQACERAGVPARRPETLRLAEVREVFARERERFPLSGTVRGSRPLVSVVICTRGRRDHLIRCLESLLRLTYEEHELILVDNNEPGAGVFDLAGQYPCRYIKALRPGLARSRNVALADSRGTIVAFTHDDAEVEPGWLDGLVGGFADPSVAAVVGPVLPRELSTQGQEWIEDVGYMGPTWFSRMEFTGQEVDPATWAGTGANMAFRRDVLVAHGGFNVLLGCGTPTSGGAEAEALCAALRTGAKVIYTPDAVVQHWHRSDLEEAQALAFLRAASRTALMASMIHRDPDLLRPMLARLLRWLVAWRGSIGGAEGAAPRSHLPFPLWLLALAYGPLTYMQSLWSERRPWQPREDDAAG
jgi:GT2 family glycosyltransferase